jgi:hypothetical protein
MSFTQMNSFGGSPHSTHHLPLPNNQLNFEPTMFTSPVKLRKYLLHVEVLYILRVGASCDIPVNGLVRLIRDGLSGSNGPE